MGIFNRQPRTNATTTTTGHANGHTTEKKPFWGRRQHGGTKHSHGHGHGHVGETYSMAKRPTFGQWLKYTWVDIATMVAMGLLGLGVSLSFPSLPLRIHVLTHNSRSTKPTRPPTGPSQ